MNQFGDLYSKYYDLLYSDKDYNAEVEYVDGLIKQYRKESDTLLDLGCGTGKHAELFSEKGYTVHGVDLSEGMLNIAKKRIKGKKDKLSFSQSNITELDLNKKFDVIVSLFHVMNYQNSNEELIKTFEVAKKHLNKEGIFIFDFWYGPAVLTDLPVTRVKRLEDDNIKIIRFVEPTLDAQTNIVEVYYDIFIENKKSGNITEKKEVHKMRYFFDTELEIICNNIGLKIDSKYEWMTNKTSDFKSWNVVWITKKESL